MQVQPRKKKVLFQSGANEDGYRVFIGDETKLPGNLQKNVSGLIVSSSPAIKRPLRIKSKLQQTLQPKLKTLVMIVRIQYTLIIWGSSRQLLYQRVCCLSY